MKPIEIFEKYLDMISADIFPGQENTILIIRDEQVCPELNTATAAYGVDKDTYVFNDCNYRKEFKGVKNGASFHTDNFLNIGVLNMETDTRKGCMYILPKMNTHIYLACVAVHEIRHRMQVILNQRKPIIKKDQYIEFQCFWLIALSVKEALIKQNHYSDEVLPIEFDAWMIERIFFRELWVNYTQRNIEFDSSIKLASRVLLMSIEELVEQMNQFCYLY